MVSLLSVAVDHKLLDRLPVLPPSLDEDNARTVTWRNEWFTYLLQVMQANGAQWTDQVHPSPAAGPMRPAP